MTFHSTVRDESESVSLAQRGYRRIIVESGVKTRKAEVSPSRDPQSPHCICWLVCEPAKSPDPPHPAGQNIDRHGPCPLNPSYKQKKCHFPHHPRSWYQSINQPTNQPTNHPPAHPATSPQTPPIPPKATRSPRLLRQMLRAHAISTKRGRPQLNCIKTPRKKKQNSPTTPEWP